MADEISTGVSVHTAGTGSSASHASVTDEVAWPTTGGTRAELSQNLIVRRCARRAGRPQRPPPPLGAARAKRAAGRRRHGGSSRAVRVRRAIERRLLPQPPSPQRARFSL